MADQCTEELPGSIVESFTLAIELVGSEIKNSPQLLTKILQNAEVQKKIKESLEKRLGELQKKALKAARSTLRRLSSKSSQSLPSMCST